jgi:hypothetical protein
MAKNEKILEHVRHRRDNMIEGDEDVEARLKKVEKK